MVARLPLPHNSRSLASLSSPPSSSSYPSWRVRKARSRTCLPSLQAPFLSPIQRFQWGPREKMRIRGWFQPASNRQREKTWQKSSVGLGASSVSLTGLSATTEGVCLHASYFWGLIGSELSLRWRGGGRQQDPKRPCSPTLGRLAGWEDPGLSVRQGFPWDSDTP